jgi:4-hydroxy-3-polyprenylbenzoate decarboxylase
LSELPVVLAISGASGAVYGKEIFDRLAEAGRETDLVITSTAEQIIKDELGVDMEYFRRKGVVRHDNSRFDAPIASGSYPTAGMIIAPCSMGCLGRIAAGVSSDLVARAADVHLKEGRRLLLVPRETPLSAIHLENMLRLKRAGAVILPAMPTFYGKPQSIIDLVQTVTGRVFDNLGININSGPRYKGNA